MWKTNGMALGLAVVLSGCSGNDGPSLISAEEQALRTYASTSGTTEAALAAGTTLHARELSEATKRLYVGCNFVPCAGAVEMSDSAISLREVGDALVLTIDGTDYELISAYQTAPNRRRHYWFDGTGRAADMFLLTGTYDDLLNEAAGGQYAHLFTVYSVVDPTGTSDIARRSFFVIGTETRDSVLRSLPNATYTGIAEIRFDPATDFFFEPSQSNVLSGDLTLLAEFGAERVSGSIGNLALSEGGGGDTTPAGSVILEQTTLTENAFQGEISPDATLLAADADLGAALSGQASYGGAFYGPSANEVGGTMETSATAWDGDSYIGVGGFHGTD